MKIRTQTCGIVDIEPKDVFEIWEDGIFRTDDFTHTLRCRDVTGKYAHHVYGISTKAALRLSELSGIPIKKSNIAEDGSETEEKQQSINNPAIA